MIMSKCIRMGICVPISISQRTNRAEVATDVHWGPIPPFSPVPPTPFNPLNPPNPSNPSNPSNPFTVPSTPKYTQSTMVESCGDWIEGDGGDWED